MSRVGLWMVGAAMAERRLGIYEGVKLGVSALGRCAAQGWLRIVGVAYSRSLGSGRPSRCAPGAAGEVIDSPDRELRQIRRS